MGPTLVVVLLPVLAQLRSCSVRMASLGLKRQVKTGSPWLCTTAELKAKPSYRLFCFPHSGASATVFFPWCSNPIISNNGIEILAVQVHYTLQTVTDWTPFSEL